MGECQEWIVRSYSLSLFLSRFCPLWVTSSNAKKKPHYSATWACGPSGTEEGVCRKTSDGTDVGLTVYFTNYLSITLTDGSATATASSGQSQSTSASASEGASGSESETTPTPTPTSGSEEETPTGGVPRATGAGPAGLLLGGAAVALMGAVL